VDDEVSKANLKKFHYHVGISKRYFNRSKFIMFRRGMKSDYSKDHQK